MLMYEPPIGKVVSCVDFELVKIAWCSVVVFGSSVVVVSPSQTLLAPGFLQFRVKFPFDNAIKFQT